MKLGAVVIFQDITALKQLQHLRQDFMALVAHDLRTPLQSVLLQLDALMQRAAGEATSVPLTTLQLMKRNGQRLDRLVRDLLDASQVDSQGIHLDLVTVRLPELASSIVFAGRGRPRNALRARGCQRRATGGFSGSASPRAGGHESSGERSEVFRCRDAHPDHHRAVRSRCDTERGRSWARYLSRGASTPFRPLLPDAASAHEATRTRARPLHHEGTGRGARRSDNRR